MSEETENMNHIITAVRALQGRRGWNTQTMATWLDVSMSYLYETYRGGKTAGYLLERLISKYPDVAAAIVAVLADKE